MYHFLYHFQYSFYIISSLFPPCFHPVSPLDLTVCVDEVAASGGYLMAAVADTVVASPFAMLVSHQTQSPLTLISYLHLSPFAMLVSCATLCLNHSAKRTTLTGSARLAVCVD